jgi:hypothetical protein
MESGCFYVHGGCVAREDFGAIRIAIILMEQISRQIVIWAHLHRDFFRENGVFS